MVEDRTEVLSRNVAIYQSTLRNNPEEQTSYLHRNGRTNPHMSRVDTGRTAGGWLSGACGNGRDILWSEKRKRQTAGGVVRGT
jgi:hypothetical protein